jgi:hypothetical protein
VNHPPRPPPCDFRFLLSQFQLFSTPARARATETLQLERTLSDLVNQAYGLTPAEIELLWKTAPPRMPIPPPFLSSGMPECSQSQVRSSGLGKADSAEKPSVTF